MLKGTGVAAFWPDLGFLAAFATLTVGLSSVRLRRLWHDPT